ncbi:MAG: non-canonical purine NTP pyrophosphatase, partial [Myxococcales bacterium]|nr:non-canonical purine NTP pyrophosphatase [Myxococcales bacterium]
PARFRCALALVDPSDGVDGTAHIVEARCEGAISRERRGLGGFGYDPVFLVGGTGRTMAELDPAEKNQVSHRARAVEAIRPWLLWAAQRG